MLIEHPDEYKCGLRVVFLVKRNKDAGGQPIQAVDKRTVFVTESISEYNDLTSYLYNNMKEGHRIYSSLDERVLAKAILEFKKMQLAADESVVQQKVFYDSLNRAWHKSLMTSRSRKSKLFLFDADSEDEAEFVGYWFDQLKITPLHTYETKNGVHFITQPFNTKVLPKAVADMTQRNAMILRAFK